MAWHIYIAGIDRLPDYQKETLEIEKALTYEIDTCKFQIKGTKPSQGDEVIIEDDSQGRLFGGTVSKVEMTDKNNLLFYDIDCDDYTDLLDRRLVVETYSNIAADAIFRDIAAKYCPGFTVNGVRSGAPTIEYMVFDYVKPSECFKQLCDYIGWEWQPDYYKDLQFFSIDDLTSPAPLVLVPGGDFIFGKHTIDKQSLKNRVYVKGGTMLSDPQTVSWVADGVATQWVLPWVPSNYSLTVGGLTKAVGIDSTDTEADYDYMVNLNDVYIRCSLHTATPNVGTIMSLTAKQSIDVITMVEDVESQQALAAVEGGDGIYEEVIANESLTTLEAAEAAGQAEIDEYANPTVTGEFTTHITGWNPGQIVIINLPDRGIDDQFLVQKVTVSRGIKFWSSKIEYGGRLKGIADFLKALVSAQQSKQSSTSALLHKFVRKVDIADVEDILINIHKGLPFVCGDSQAICGYVQCDNGGDWVFISPGLIIPRDSFDPVNLKIITDDNVPWVFLGPCLVIGRDSFVL